MKRILAITFAIFLVSCAPMVNPTPTETMIPTAIITPIPSTPTNVPTSTPKPTKTPIPIVYVTLSSPFAADCGDNLYSVVRANDTANGIDLPYKRDATHGHGDYLVPAGCNIDKFEGELVSPIPAYRISMLHEGVYDLYLPQGYYLEGLLDVLSDFMGIQNASYSDISSLRVTLGHVYIDPNLTSVTQGQVLGDLVWEQGQPKIAYQIYFTFRGDGYVISPTLLPNRLADGTILRPMLNGVQENWLCQKDVPTYASKWLPLLDCVPTPADYAP